MIIGGAGTGDDSSGDGEEGIETGVDEPGPESPILGFPSQFDLPPSLVLDSHELPVSRFASPERSMNDLLPPLPPSVNASAPVIPRNTITAETTPGLKRKQTLMANTPVTAPEEDGKHSHAANKRPQRSKARGTDIHPPVTGVKVATMEKVAGGRTDTTGKDTTVKGTAARKEPGTRKDLSSSSASTPAVNPPWLTSALSMLESEELGEGWKFLIQTWVNFERKECNHPPSVLSSSY